MVKCLSAMQDARVQSLGWENPLQKEMATHSSILAWKIPWTEEPGGLQSMGSQRVGYDKLRLCEEGKESLWQFSLRFFFFFFFGVDHLF